MSVYFAEFVIQRDGAQYTCRGDKLYERVREQDLFAIHRDGTLWRGTKDKIRDSDYLVCIEDNETKRVAGSLVIPLLLPPPLLAPVVVKIDGVVWNQDQAEPATAPAESEVTLSIETNPESASLSKTYNWEIRNGVGEFTSSPGARNVVYKMGTQGQVATISSGVSAIGAGDSPQSGDVISLLAT